MERVITIKYVVEFWQCPPAEVGDKPCLECQAANKLDAQRVETAFHRVGWPARIVEIDSERDMPVTQAKPNSRRDAEAVAMQDLERCAAEILDWRKAGRLADDALTRKVAAVWERDGDVLPEQQAENTIVLLALRQVASRA